MTRFATLEDLANHIRDKVSDVESDTMVEVKLTMACKEAIAFAELLELVHTIGLEFKGIQLERKVIE